MIKTLKNFLRDRQGATAIEYALIAGLISIAIITGASQIGTSSIMNMDALSSAMGSAGN